MRTPLARLPLGLLSALILLPAAVGCGADSDGDGVPDEADCAPEDPERLPGAPDAWGDGVDQNCDSVDGTDADGDGWPGDADPDDPTFDCDDADPAVSPGDTDNDGWSGCGGDCDDRDSIAHPGAWDEPGDGLDDDCDGGDLGSLGFAHAAFRGIAGDKAGESVASLGDIDGDGLADIAVGAPFGQGDASETGRAYVIFGATFAAGGTVPAADADVIITGEVEGDRLGSWVASAGDIDGDDAQELLIGVPRSDDNGHNAGKVLLFLGSTLAAGGNLSATNADAVWVGENWGDTLAMGASAGDVDGDGRGDILLGAWAHDGGGTDAGKAYLFLSTTILAGPPDAGRGPEPPSPGPCARIFGFSACDADAMFIGNDSDDRAGRSVGTAGDLDGDGHADLLIGVPGDDDGGPNAGAVAVFSGARVATAIAEANPDVPGDVAFRVTTGADALALGGQEDNLGESLAALSDIDGDGVTDLFAGSCRSRTNVVPTRSSATIWSGGALLGGGELTPHTTFAPPEGAEGGGFCSTAAAGDVDGDGIGDVLIGDVTADTDPPGAGVASLLLGAGLAGGDATPGDADYAFLGEGRDEHAGWSLGAAGDVDGDGRDDLLVSAVRNPDGGQEAGKVYVLLSPL